MEMLKCPQLMVICMWVGLAGEINWQTRPPPFIVPMSAGLKRQLLGGGGFEVSQVPVGLCFKSAKFPARNPGGFAKFTAH